VSRDNCAPPNAAGIKEPRPRGYWARRVLLILAAAIVLPLVFFIVRQVSRDRSLLAFCEAAKPNISFSELLSLEKQHSIDDTYLVQARFEGFVDQATSFSLEFRSQRYDPDFACAIGHDGRSVKHVQLLTLEGAKKP
jgi:hypothetical protein